ncbi:MAG TPA: hypothetical protein VN549_04090 [Negativicutes bacterium]|nr:hypothetical protein [Negativicutes bacterium]
MIFIDNSFCREIIDINDSKHSIGIKKLGDEEFQKIRKLAQFLKSYESSFSKEIELVSTLLEVFDICDIEIKLESDEKLNRIK